jgi:hypothetical protein
MVTKVREVPAELIPHIATIKEVAKKYGINQIGLDVFVEEDLPYETAILKLEYDLPKDIDERSLERDLSMEIGIATYLTNINSIDERLRALAHTEFRPL